MKMVPYIELERRALLQQGATKRRMAELASRISDDFEKAYLADVDGIVRNKPQLDVAQKICDEIPTMYEGGIRYSGNLIDMLITGAESAVVGTATLVELEELRAAFKLSENITFKVDFRDGIESFDPDMKGRAISALLEDVSRIGVRDVVVPRELAKEIAGARAGLEISLGVFAQASDGPEMERLGFDYLVCEDYGSLMSDE